MVLLKRVENRSADVVTCAPKGILRPYRDSVHTITTDNGKEFARFADVADSLGADIHFARPCHCWEQGLNEHINGSVREYIPKGTDFPAARDREVRAVQDALNDRPWRALDYDPLLEAFRMARSVE